MYTQAEAEKIIKDAADRYYEGSDPEDILGDLPKKVWKRAALKMISCDLEVLIDELEGPRDTSTGKSTPDVEGSPRWRIIKMRDVVEALLQR
jgi:hypothetical protein